MDVEIAGRPETIDGEDAAAVVIRIPLSAEPDELLTDALDQSAQISSFCVGVQASEQQLVVVLKEEGLSGLGTVLTAIEALLKSTNAERAIQSMSDEERAAEEALARRREVDAQLGDWWEQRG